MNISFSPPDISELEISEVTQALRSGWITTVTHTAASGKTIL
jgi:dTDP-4-amino-4,6-dideoxygalactose transaminase